MNIVSYLMIGLLGASIGSFINVLADRLVSGESILGRSRCDHCKRTLSFLDLIPVVSYISLRGKCGTCKKALSLQYPLVEITSALSYFFVFALFQYQNPVNGDLVLLVYQFTIVSTLLVIIVTDVKYRIIPDEMNIFMSIVALLYLFVRTPQFLGVNILSAILFALFFFFLALITGGRGMGMGDVKYVAAAGLVLGFIHGIIALYLSFLTGAIVSLILIMKGTKRMKSTIAFGPFLATSTLVAFLFGDQLWNVFVMILGI